MLDMRLRIPELMERRDSSIRTAYGLWKASRDKAPENAPRVPMSTAHRIVTTRGAIDRIDMRTLDALCIAFEIGPENLLTNKPLPPEPPAVLKRKSKRA